MTDRELIETAARAAGIVGTWDEDRGGLEIAVPWRNFINYETWNPLKDDGDRYRLAKVCRLRIDFHLHRVLTQYGTLFNWTAIGQGDDEAHAIVRAAAEMEPKY